MVGEFLDYTPVGLYERLRQIDGYTWDECKPAYHSSYNNWVFFGTQDIAEDQNYPNKSKTQNEHQSSQQVSSSDGECSTKDGPGDKQVKQVIARVSTHVLREERAYHICMSMLKKTDPEANYFVRPIKLVQLPSQPGDIGPLIVSILEYEGPNYLLKVIDYGPAYYTGRRVGDKHESFRDDTPLEPMELQTFMDFAVGATECLEILHHRQHIAHGEIRGDAFHMNAETGKVKILNFGSGLRTFEHGLTSNGWSMLSKEVGAKTKLCFMAPEQTGRMPTEPDSRTDIYSLGILFWTILIQQPAFRGETPMDIIQAVLGRRLPIVSNIRLDIPDVVGRIIQKMTSKMIGDRYHSATGLKYDLVEVRRLLGIGDSLALKNWKIASRDVSSFFILPTIMIGRSKERDKIVKVIDNVSKHLVSSTYEPQSATSIGTSLSEGRIECSDITFGVLDHLSSDGDAASSMDGRSSPFTSNSMPGDTRWNISSSSQLRSTTNSFQHSTHDSLDSSGRIIPVFKPWEKIGNSSFDCSRNIVESVNSDQQSKILSDGVSSLSNLRNSHRRHRKGCCEIISIAGAAGLGKTCLVQSVQIEARRRGYFASSKFDQAKRTAFGPVLKLLSSLFKQVFSESDTETPFHQILKRYVQPAWPLLHKLLDLPVFLLGPTDVSIPNRINYPGLVTQNNYNKSLRSELRKRDSSPSSKNTAYNMTLVTQSAQDFFRAGSSTKSLRLSNTCLDVLRVFIQHKFICLCLDDLQFADDESLDFLTQILASGMRIVIIVTYRPEESLSEKVKCIIDPSFTKDSLNGFGVGITKVNLSPLGEKDTRTYVAATLRRDELDIATLADVIRSKTGGNPFNMREMLNSCYRRRCIYYDYKENGWCYDMEKIFMEYSSSICENNLNGEFAISRLKELPLVSRAILVWASYVGHSFSFDLIRRLLGGEFDYEDGDLNRNLIKTVSRYSQQDIIEGLQSIIQACIITETQDDDRFCFTHDRYMQAASSLDFYPTPKAHFIISQTLLKYNFSDGCDKETIAMHIGKSIDIIKAKVTHRRHFREVLLDCAQSATENGAPNTAIRFYQKCFALLQDDPWKDKAVDVYYEETLNLHIRAAECYVYSGRELEATKLLDIIFSHAHTEVDKAPAWVLKSRIFAQKGDSFSAFRALKACLKGLGIEVHDESCFEKCDAEFERLIVKIQSLDIENLISRPGSKDTDLSAVGIVLVETISAAYWTDQLQFYQMTLVMVNIHLTYGEFPQVGMAYVYLATIAISRFNMIKFACQMAKVSKTLVDKWQDPYTIGRRKLSYTSFVGHLEVKLQDSLSEVEESFDYSIQSGDRISTITNFGFVGQIKFSLSENLVDLEAFMCYGCEDVPNWIYDTRGGSLAIAVRQLCRALQGKTSFTEPLDIMSDDEHDSQNYKLWLKKTVENSDRQIFFYESMEIAPLFLYGHYDRAVEIGASCLTSIDAVWSSRQTRFVMLIYGLSLSSLIWLKISDPLRTVSGGIRGVRSEAEYLQSENALLKELEDSITQIKSLKKKIEDWQVVSDVNYLSWSKLLSAQIAEMEGQHGIAMKKYEQSLDHASANKNLFEEALGNYLLAGFFLRSSSRRAAKEAMREATHLFRVLGAVGVTNYIENQHILLLQDPMRIERTVDAAVQTSFAAVSDHVRYESLQTIEDNTLARTQTISSEADISKLGTWPRESAQDIAESGLLALDMLDLTSILKSSQVISSVLQIDQLLKTMCEIILHNCGGLATTAAIVVDEDPVGWSIAASGDPEKGAEAHIPGIPLGETAIVAEGVILYCARFRETVFVPDLIRDERFSNVMEAWASRNPHGKSVIAIPICHGNKSLLGALYLEGEPNAFTDRNLTLLQLLVNQIGISYSNALTWKEVEKVSASNKAMVALQKAALKKSLVAEEKANQAKAEALRNVELAEEAVKAKSIFLANVSHELRTPLNGVIGNSELLRDSCLTKDQAEMADSIRVSADLLLTVINDILDFSKIEADKMELYIVAFRADEMMREIFRSVSFSNKGKKKNVTIMDDIKLPKCLVFGDPVRLHQVLGNLVSNSMKFTEYGTIIVGARTDLETQDNLNLKFWVRDTGIGIPQQKLDKLFKPFSQADPSTARKYGGSGLGLSICKSLVESMMGGMIGLESIEGQGTTCWFTITFPKTSNKASPGDLPNSEKKNSRTVELQPEVSKAPFYYLTHIPREEIRVCIAEDNPVNKKIAIQFMHKLGFRYVDAYENGLEAVEGLRLKAKEGSPYHIVLMDVQMPILDGYEATKLIRQDSNDTIRRILVIAMTASAIQGDREKCLASGMNDYLAKPVRSNVLKDKLNYYLHQSTPPTTKLSQKITNGTKKSSMEDKKILKTLSPDGIKKYY
ncbi:Peroxide stress-activated histidine kinase mak3 [Erysiphe neolycopersici]|uniref:histidine kinase n=1 Tax=Erysiphe neolycopersici TaxID=212602 RepID=A0A420I7N0_9PEZI|nr:Peroxide stress-activated histidine kinase mak3 [Erysiphe neolycopersici]